MEKTMRERVLTIKDIKEQHHLTVSQMMNIVADHGGYVAERTIRNILKDGSENHGKFQYHTVADLYTALVAEYGEKYADADTETLKNEIRERNKQIDSLMIHIENQESSWKKRLEFFEERKKNFEETITILKSQVERLETLLEYREKSLAVKDEILMKMLDSYVISKE